MIKNKLTLKESNDDFVEINGLKLPKDYVMQLINNASTLGMEDAKSVSDKLTNTKKEEPEEPAVETEPEIAIDMDKVEKLYSYCKESVDNKNTLDDKLSVLSDILVPSSGKCDTEAGECIRAINRIMYRYYNDGDYFYKGYGLETAGPSAAYLMDNTTDDIYASLMNTADDGYEGSYYNKTIDKIAENVIEFIFSNKNLFGTSPVDSRYYTHSNTYRELVELDMQNEYDIDTSGDLESYIENDCITWEDFEYWLEDLTTYYGGEVSRWAQDGFTITNLSSDNYREWEEHFFSELNSYLNDLAEEFPNFGEDEEEYED